MNKIHTTFWRVSGRKEGARSYTGNEMMNATAEENSLDRAGLTGQWLSAEKSYKLHEQERQLQTALTGNGWTQKTRMSTVVVVQG